MSTSDHRRAPLGTAHPKVPSVRASIGAWSSRADGWCVN
jgi:hypothetical protein